MPGYGLTTSTEGLLPWSWAVERLTRSHDYWVASSWPDGRPHVMPVWGIYADDAIWFSSSRAARKARNLMATARCVVTTDNPQEPVVVEGDARLVDALDQIQVFVERINAKYETSYGLDFFDPRTNACFSVKPVWAFALTESDFTGSPTRWRFPVNA